MQAILIYSSPSFLMLMAALKKWDESSPQILIWIPRLMTPHKQQVIMKMLITCIMGFFSEGQSRLPKAVTTGLIQFYLWL